MVMGQPPFEAVLQAKLVAKVRPSRIMFRLEYVKSPPEPLPPSSVCSVWQCVAVCAVRRQCCGVLAYLAIALAQCVKTSLSADRVYVVMQFIAPKVPPAQRL